MARQAAQVIEDDNRDTNEVIEVVRGSAKEVCEESGIPLAPKPTSVQLGRMGIMGARMNEKKGESSQRG